MKCFSDLSYKDTDEELQDLAKNAIRKFKSLR